MIVSEFSCGGVILDGRKVLLVQVKNMKGKKTEPVTIAEPIIKKEVFILLGHVEQLVQQWELHLLWI